MRVQTFSAPIGPMTRSPTHSLTYLLFAALCLFSASRLWAESDKCSICGQPITNSLYLVTDKVSDQQKMVCADCLVLPRCFICGLPVKENFTALHDGRVLCARDALTSVLSDEDAQRISGETREALDRLLWRFLAFPETNLTVVLADRVNLQDLFKYPGNDYTCPNVWGYMNTRTNHGHLEHSVRVLSGLPTAAFKATCAHEYGHAWLNENLPFERKPRLSRDSIEGFCELVSFLLMESEHQEGQMEQIQQNAYTRGQIQLFIEAERRFGFNDVLDWIKYGTDDSLQRENLNRIRDLETHPRQSPQVAVLPAPYFRPPAQDSPRRSAPAADTAEDALVLQAVIWAKVRPLALINGRTFEVQEQGSVRVGKTNVILRCLAISQDSVRVKIVSSGQEQQLRIRNP